MPKEPMYWLDELKRIGSIWLHDGNPSRPHALLTSGKHSDGFVNTGLASCRPDLISCILDEKNGYQSGLPDPGTVDWVVGSAMGAITWSFALAGYLGAKSAFTEKSDDKMLLKRFAITPEDTVLVCEDVISTGGSTLKTLAALKETSCNILPSIAVIMNRSGKTELDGHEILSVVDLELKMWEAADCELCKTGSKVVRPKQHWDALTREY